MKDRQFVKEELFQQLEEEQNDDRLNEYLQRIAHTMYGLHIKSAEREKEGKLKCIGIIIYLDCNNLVHLFDDEKAIIREDLPGAVRERREQYQDGGFP